jgi:Dyp-type peroxidase family
MGKLDTTDIQGNILRGYGFDHAEHLFARLDEPAKAREFLSALGLEITREHGESGKPQTTLNVAFSAAGLRRLGVELGAADAFPAFDQGMFSRAARLGDDEQLWDPIWRSNEAHVWIAVHAREEAALEARVSALRTRARGLGFIDYALRGKAIRRGDARLEHFGFRDGISDPAVLGRTNNVLGPGTARSTADGRWAPLATGEFLLGHPDESKGVSGGRPSPLTANGTFVVLRKLRQHVGRFRDYVSAMSTELGMAPEFVAARLVGRDADGVPLAGLGAGSHVAASRPQGSDPSKSGREELNAFGYAADRAGAACPLGAHIRRTNPRDGDRFPQLSLRHRLLRRGMPYGDPLAPEAPEDGVDRGLIFVAMNASIERQFEFVQQRWINDGSSTRQGLGADPLIGRHTRERQGDAGGPSGNGMGSFVVQGDPMQRRMPFVCHSLPQFVDSLGGEYFFMPGLGGYQRLLEAARGRAVARHQLTQEAP